MEVIQLSERRMYWSVEAEIPFVAPHLGRYMSRRRFEQILSCLPFFLDEEYHDEGQTYWEAMDQLVGAMNTQFKSVLSAGSQITIDESMIKAFHRNLPGKVKIRRKPRPVGNEVYDLCDSLSMIVLHIEFNQGKENNKKKEFEETYATTKATTLRLTKDYWGSNRTFYMDLWFASVVTSELFLEHGLHSVGVVKTAHKHFPKALLDGEAALSKGEWRSVVAMGENSPKIWGCRYMDRKKFDFIATCSSDLDGTPRISSRRQEVKRPRVASDYFRCAGSIDRHNHYRTGGVGMEDALMTKQSSVRQLCGLFGFIETNAFLSYLHFTSRMLSHDQFKRKLVVSLLEYSDASAKECPTTRSTRSVTEVAAKVAGGHVLVKYKGSRKQRRCYYCYHGYHDRREFRSCYHCSYCGFDYALCAPTTGRNCWALHLQNGMPMKKRRALGSAKHGSDGQ